MRKSIILLFFVCSLFASSKGEKMFWNEVKDSNDIEMLKLYKKRYPNGIFETLADLKIKRLKKANNEEVKEEGEPFWIDGETNKYRYFGIGKANTHYQGKEYQLKLAKRRALLNINDMFEDEELAEERIEELTNLIQEKKYIDENERIYIMLYIDNDDL